MFTHFDRSTDSLCQMTGCNSRWQHRMAYGVDSKTPEPKYLCTYHASKLLDMRDKERKKDNANK